jgi:hypothetical protein
MRQECGTADHEIAITLICELCVMRYKTMWQSGLNISNLYVQGSFMSNSTPFAVEEHIHGETVWVALRSRGADWSWLTPDEAVQLGREWIAKYASVPLAAE